MTYVTAKYSIIGIMVSQRIRNYLKTIGRKGGKERAAKFSSATLSSQARHAVVTRWMRKRFGVDNFKALALPGGEIVDVGLRDLINENFSSVQALAVAELRPRLRFLRVPLPNVSNQISKPRTLLYRTMEVKEGGMAYVRFCALLERLDSFCDALVSIIPTPRHTAHRHRRWYA